MNVFPSEIERVARELSFVDECIAITYVENGKPFIRLLVEGSISDAQKRAAVAHIAKMSKIDVLKLQEEYGR